MNADAQFPALADVFHRFVGLALGLMHLVAGDCSVHEREQRLASQRERDGIPLFVAR